MKSNANARRQARESAQRVAGVRDRIWDGRAGNPQQGLTPGAEDSQVQAAASPGRGPETCYSLPSCICICGWWLSRT